MSTISTIAMIMLALIFSYLIYRWYKELAVSAIQSQREEEQEAEIEKLKAQNKRLCEIVESLRYERTHTKVQMIEIGGKDD